MGNYSIAVDAIRASVNDLRQRKLHPNFAGYLCVKREVSSALSGKSVKPKFKSFFDEFLTVPEGVSPYLVPFKETGSLESSPWFNGNVAGSYAPSSLRDGGTFLKVCSVDRETGLFSLKDNHAQLALNHLASSQKIPTVTLATFLYRDVMFQAAETPTANQLVEVFRDEFGYRKAIADEAKQYSLLFSDENPLSGALFEEIQQ